MKSKIKNKAEKKYEKKRFVVDTSAIIGGKLAKLINKGLTGIIMIPNAVIAELENLANKGRDEGIEGLGEIARLHSQKQIKIRFIGKRPNAHQIRFAKSGEIDALVRQLAYQNRSCLITADIVQAKSAEAYGIPAKLIRIPKPAKKKKKFRLFKMRRD